MCLMLLYFWIISIHDILLKDVRINSKLVPYSVMTKYCILVP